jgi:hypothetical protein
VSWPICESCGSMSADGATCGSSSAAASERGVGEALESNSSDRKRTRHERDASVQYSTIQILLKHYIVRAVMCVVSCPMVPVGLVLRSTLCGPLTLPPIGMRRRLCGSGAVRVDRLMCRVRSGCGRGGCGARARARVGRVLDGGLELRLADPLRQEIRRHVLVVDVA